MKFDYVTHLRNKKGKVYAKQPYRMYISKEGTKLERPPGSGNFFHPNGTPIEAKKEKEVKAMPTQEKKEEVTPKIAFKKAKIEVKGESKE